MPTPGDPFRDRHAGEPFELSATTYNWLMRMLRWFKNQQLGNDAPDGEGFPDPGIVLIKNTSGSTVPRFGVLGIDGPLVTEATASATFKNRVILTGTTPASGHEGKFAILLKPLANNAVGEAVIGGAVQVQIDVQDTADQYADISIGDNDRLRSGPDGEAHILWAASGTGLKWAIVRVGAYRLPFPRAPWSVLSPINDPGDVAFVYPTFHDPTPP